MTPSEKPVPSDSIASPAPVQTPGARGSVSAFASSEAMQTRATRSSGQASDAIGRGSRFSLSSSPQDRQSYRRINQTVRVLKFGGTSVGDVFATRKTVDVIQTAAVRSSVVVVVSAMAGVTNKLLEAARCAEAGDRKTVFLILKRLRSQHAASVNTLIDSAEERGRLHTKMAALFEECEQLCQGTAFLRELTPKTCDAISSLGERLSAPLVAAALRELGVPSRPIEATELVVTTSNHGAAEPLMELTTERCELVIRPLLRQGILPVVTGFIGATETGVLTTLGRGGSDYSATILGAALNADEVTIWTDVDGVLSADPRLVPEATTIPEISYREAAELAYFGAKVLHPKTLRPLMRAGITVWIRNTFSPERAGTKITPTGSCEAEGVKALTAISDVVLVTVGGPGIVGMRDVLSRTFTASASAQADVLMVSQSSSQNDICFVIPSSCAKQAVEALRKEFSQDMEREKIEHITVDSKVAIVAAVGQKMRGMAGIAGRTFSALGRENVNVIAIAQGSSQCNISFLLASKDMKTALSAIHREFQLGAVEANAPLTVG
jgi:bifunctional aspartokinase / homoserine dehydrogenase 1